MTLEEQIKSSSEVIVETSKKVSDENTQEHKLLVARLIKSCCEAAVIEYKYNKV